MKIKHCSIGHVGWFSCFFLLSFFSFLPAAYPASSSYYDTVQKIYMGYYQRPADPAGLIYWAEKLDNSSGNLSEIIEAFANSEEAQTLYGTIDSDNISTVVNAIYQALFGRDAETAGLDYFVDGFNKGQFTAATIMLNILDGAQNEDLASVNNKLTAANLFTRTIDPELDGSSFQATYQGDADAAAGRTFLSSYADSENVPTQAETTAFIQANIADAGDPILSSTTVTASTTTLTASSTAVTSGSSITFTATVSPSDATGTVIFYDGTTSLGIGTLSSGSASLTTSELAVGTHAVIAIYGGSESCAASASDLVTVTVSEAAATNVSISLAASPTTITYGSGVALIVVVSPITSTGTVTFYDGMTQLGTADLVSGSATAALTTAALTAGTHTITAAYSSVTSSAATVTVTSASAGSFSSGTLGYGTAAYLLTSGTLTTTGASYATSTNDRNAVGLTGTSAYLTLINPTISTGGGTSSTDDSSFYGLNAAVLDYNGGNITIDGGTITTTGQGANDVFSYGTGIVTISNAAVTATGANGHGLYAAGGGTMIVNNVTASSTGSAGSIVATDKGGGTITITGGSYSASGQRSAGIYSTGTVTATNATFTATNAEAIVVEGSNTCTLTNCTINAVSGTSEHRGIFLYQSMSGDADNSTCGTGACFTMTGGAFTYTDTTDSSSTATSNCAAFVVANQVAHFTLTDVAVNNSCPTLLLSALNSNWNYNGGTTTFKAYGETLTGNVIVDSVSTADIYLYASSNSASTLTGKINTDNTGKTVALTLDAASQWVVTGTSYLTTLTNADSTNSNITCETAGCKVYVGGTAITIN